MAKRCCIFTQSLSLSYNFQNPHIPFSFTITLLPNYYSRTPPVYSLSLSTYFVAQVVIGIHIHVNTLSQPTPGNKAMTLTYHFNSIYLFQHPSSTPPTGLALRPIQSLTQTFPERFCLHLNTEFYIARPEPCSIHSFIALPSSDLFPLA